MKEIVKELRDALENLLKKPKKPLRLEEILRNIDGVDVNEWNALLPAAQEAVQHVRTARQALLRADRVLEAWPGGAEPATGVLNVSSNDDLLAELRRRGALAQLHGAIGALYDHLDRTGALDSKLTQYLSYRLRREEAAITAAPDTQARVANWQECIDEMHSEDLRVIHSTSESTLQGEPVFWSNDLGWVDLSTATRFMEEERQSVNLPVSSGDDAQWLDLEGARKMANDSSMQRPRS